MSDKSFGDYTNKNLMKNPLLSTAVTGLSIEDLTQNAVLLPVVQTQGLVTAQDLQGSQNIESRIETPHFPSGDSKFIPSINVNQTSTIETQKQNTKDITKSDDFDVNEYFARLQGTRYVSAPINAPQDDKATNLQPEDNLEEINLNEPEKQIDQQSITADIAHNFSQLPTVLPHVASAVFSSFTNMLSYKREQTPEVKGPEHQQVQVPRMEQEQASVQLMGVDAVDVHREIAPPPKEPPPTGIGNYRLATKKKYAQLPGLSSNHSMQNYPTYNPVDNNVPSYFVPSETQNEVVRSNNSTTSSVPEEKAYNIFEQPPESSNNQAIVFDNFNSNNGAEFKTETNQAQNSQNVNSTLIQHTSNPIIPPPPMFSNIPKRDSITGVGKSILPPSVARRIASNQSVTQSQPQLPTFDNIFVPQPVPEVGQAPQFSYYQSDTSSTDFFNRCPTVIASQSSLSSSIAIPNESVLANVNLPELPSPGTLPSEETPPRNVSSLFESTRTLPSSESFTIMPSAAPAVLQETPVNVFVPSNTDSSVSYTNAAPPTFFDPTVLLSSQTANVSAPPTFFNPMTTQIEALQAEKTQSFDIHPVSELPKILEPPKLASGNVNFRMAKKKPQYYSGPIEGFGSISNNYKPILPPVEVGPPQAPFQSENAVESNSLANQNITQPFYNYEAENQVTQDVFTPTQSSDIQANAQTLPFDITQPTNVTPFVSTEPEQSINQQYYSTAFDMSRQTTDYVEQKQEPKGFGIIGSLKSKLSSINIDKIQNSVTTFFDPAYNDSKKETGHQENVTYGHQDANNYSQYDNSNLEIFVASVPEGQNYSHNQYYQQCNPSNYEYNQGNSYYETPESQCQTTYSNYYSSTDAYAQSEYVQRNNNPEDLICPNQPYDKKFDTDQNSTAIQKVEKATETFNNNSTGYNSPEQVFKIQNQNETIQTEHASSAISFFENPSLNDSEGLDSTSFFASTSKDLRDSQKSIELEKKSHLYIADSLDAQTKSDQLFSVLNKDACEKHSSDAANTANIFMPKHVDIWAPSKDEEEVNEKNLDILDRKPFADTFHITDGISNKIDNRSYDMFSSNVVESSVFGLSEETICDKNFVNLEKDITHLVDDFKTDEDDTNNVIKFFNKGNSIKEELLGDREKKEDVTDLDICETCREVDKPEEREPEDVTAQMIENIIAPIQLLNPVEVPLPESNINDVDVSAFETEQCNEMIRITEKTIESIHVQTATELLGDLNIYSDNFKDYGWAKDNPVHVENHSVLLEHGYSKPNVESIGFHGQSGSIFGLSSNVSDEIKADFKDGHEELSVLLPRQMSIPTAPPAEDSDDAKSDDGGLLDVHSIERDASKDFPIFEEYVIEPSETDDDKIEYIIRENSPENSKENDTFTNRVENYKKMEDRVEESEEAQSSLLSLGLQSPTSPVITMASYFDTGNYAADTHYRNSLTSPSSLAAYNISSPYIPVRIPPGFENEYQAKLNSMHSSLTELIESEPYIPDTNTQTIPTTTLTLSSDHYDSLATPNPTQIEQNEPYIPDTDTQTRFTPTLTCSLPSALSGNVVTMSHKEVTIESQKLPEFSSVFCAVRQSFDQQTESIDKPKICFEPNPLLLPDQVNFFASAVTEESKPAQTVAPNPLTLPDPVNFFSAVCNPDAVPCQNAIPNPQLSATLTDPETFFSSSTTQETTENSSFNRLASYFASPPKADPTKPFFELSQSQNHYRHEIKGIESATNDAKNLSNCNQNRDRIGKSIQNIPEERYLDSLNLVKDLTSFKEFSPKENIVRTVNYFTIEYDKTKNLNTGGEPCSVKSENFKINDKLKEIDEIQENNLENVIKNCKYCCNHIGAILESEFNSYFKKAMDSDSSEESRLREGSMEPNRETRRSTNVCFEDTIRDETNISLHTANDENRSLSDCPPVKHHWFYRVNLDGKSIWRGFSVVDSRTLEEAFHSSDLDENTLVPTDGGRYDVNIVGRLRISVYWKEKPTNVRRCSWFYKGTTDPRYVPYTEEIAEKLEEEYRHGIRTGEWHRRLVLNNTEVVVMHGPSVMVHFLNGNSDGFNTPTQSTSRPRVVRRGHDESEIEDTEPSSIDHLLLLCHGVGSACDMRFRSVEEVVDDFRATSLQLIQSHYRNSYDNAAIGRVEVLPISWHSTLHSGEAGVDRRLAQITLDSIPKLRNFTNDTVLDVLFYTSPVFCQTIIDTVCNELNRIYNLFKSRNPEFNGGVSLGGHSLGSVILYDLLCHQKPTSLLPRSSSKRYVEGGCAAAAVTVQYPALHFAPATLYALGSPIAIFECIRGVETLGKEFSLPTCKNFFNIFHPYDPIAYRIEPLINPDLKLKKPFQIPHHKGRKRMHLELKDTMARVGSDLKQKLVESLRATWASMWKQPPDNTHLEKVVEEQFEKEELTQEIKEENEVPSPETLGLLNGGRRIDYVLQEAPFEMINEYLFAMSSHVCYWESEDTMLLMLREIYNTLGVHPDSTVPQLTMTVNRARPIKDDIVYYSPDYPSTSRGGVL